MSNLHHLGVNVSRLCMRVRVPQMLSFFPIAASSGVLPSNNLLAIIPLIVEKLSLVIWFRRTGDKIRSRTMKSIDG